MPVTLKTAPRAIEVRGLTKRFVGEPSTGRQTWGEALVRTALGLLRRPSRRTVVDGVDLSVDRGEFFGILGANGAGKTTLLKLLCCVLAPDAGGGTVNGHDLLRRQTEVRRSITIGQAGGAMGVLFQLTGRQNLLFRARLCGLPGTIARTRVAAVLDRLGVTDKADSHSFTWSAGERQKFNLAMAFVAPTPIVLLDEPTSHLDPRAAREVRRFAKEDLNGRNGQTVLMSTHYLEEADALCDRVAILHEGRVLACDTPAALKRRYVPERLLEVRVTGYTPEIGARVRRRCSLEDLLEHFEDLATGRARLRPKWACGASMPDALRAALEDEGVGVTTMRDAAPTLDDVYFRLTGGQAAGTRSQLDG